MSDTNKIPILIISYLFPPRGGVGVQRITKFVKYLPDNGFKPIVLTVKKPSGAVAEDSALLDEIPDDIEIVRTSSLEPYHIYRAMGGKRAQDDPSFRGELVDKGTKKGFLSKLYFEFQRRCLIPDPKIGWFKPAVNAGNNIISKHSPKLILSTSPEATAHLVAKKLHGKYQIPWLADFRDPWVSGYYSLNRPESAALKEKNMERDVLSDCDAVTVVMQSYIDGFRNNHPDIDFNKFKIIPNGFDEDDYLNLKPRSFDKFTIAHTGSIYHQRSPVSLFKAIAQFLNNDLDARNKFSLHLVGRIDTRFLKTAEEMGISDIIQTESFSSHDTAISTQLGADVLLILSEGMMTAKIYEYLRAQKPVIAIAPDGELNNQIAEWGIGKSFTPDKTSEIADFIGELYNGWLNNQKPIMTDFKQINLEQFERSHQAKQLADILNSMLPAGML